MEITSQQKEAPHVAVNAQYIKDFSFENPGAPGSLAGQGTPEIELSLDLNIQKMEEEDFFEVEIVINAKATREDKTLFIIDLAYAGIFHLINIPEEQTQMILAITCPTIIFPFARKIIADATQDGGFQPLMIDPVDFSGLYAKKIGQQQKG